MPQQTLHEFCTVEGCGRPHKGRGYCNAHYARFIRGATIDKPINTRDSSPAPTCKEPGCEEPTKSRGLCAAHYARLLRHGHTRYRDRKKPAKPCSVDGCDNVLYAKGVCHIHYMRAKNARKFGITYERYVEMLATQGGGCAICRRAEFSIDGQSGKVRSLAIDHCHESGAVRGLLCSSCNRAIGLLST